jgi:hypothetical protein
MIAVSASTSDAARIGGPKPATRGIGFVKSIQYIVPRGQAARMLVRPDTKLTYGGGPVLLKPHVYVVFWGFKTVGDPNRIMPLMKSFYAHVGGSELENNLTQYYGPGHKFVSNKRGWLKGAWADDTDAIPSQPTDAQVAAEAIKLVRHFGGFDPNGAYVVHTAHDHNTSGFGSAFCAYHGVTTAGASVVPYTNEPYMPDAGANCGAGIIAPPADETADDEGATIVAGAELNDLITDPQPPTGWTAMGIEISSFCNWTDIQNDPFGLRSYTSQPELDNKTGACSHDGP